jgi:hypothetical protein
MTSDVPMETPKQPISRDFDWEDDAVYRLGLLPDDTFGDISPEVLARAKSKLDATRAGQAEFIAAARAARVAKSVGESDCSKT